ncbi:MAG: hypothetical protein COT85_02335 [Chlamydiae bacterium CG10_big_fil_rev_8_21_14_0_10_42_34]|nr:MAG: hypothetical protein COT85_02335 [Chlamydiae bacterium CG10_big_fil_rev_8_21_14_0_10_42_34]
MTIDHYKSDSLVPYWGQIFKPSHRTRPEQLLGLGIYLSISLSIELLGGLTTHFLGIIYSISLGLSMWSLWRRYSLRVLKLELSLFLAQFIFQLTWCLSYFGANQMLFSLVTLILLWSNTLMAALLYWKKDRLASFCLLYPLILVFFLVGTNMVTCISNL